MTLNKLAIIQARMSSSRLPGKAMCELSGQTMLQYMLERVQRAKLLDGVVLATTTDPSDDILAQLSQNICLPYYRGSLHDVLDRFYQAAAQFQADVVVRLTADCPLIDPDLIDRTVGTFLGIPAEKFLADFSQLLIDNSPITNLIDFAADRLPPPWKRTLPIGQDVEVCSFGALKRAWKEAGERYQREHVMPYLYEDITFTQPHAPPAMGWYIDQAITPRGLKVALLNHEPDYGALRWTVDTPEDLEFVRRIADRFEGQSGFTWLDVLALLEQEPDLAAINQAVKHKSAYDVDQRSSRP